MQDPDTVVGLFLCLIAKDRTAKDHRKPSLAYLMKQLPCGIVNTYEVLCATSQEQ